MKIKEGILDKIRKCFAIANDGRGNAHEGQTAILKAQQLMAEHGISESQLMEKPCSDVEDNTVTGFNNFLKWHGQLGKIIADNFKCFCYLRTKNINGRCSKAVSFVGLSDDIKIAKEVFYYAITMINYYTTLYTTHYKLENPKANIKEIENSFTQGYLKGLFTKFEEQKKQNKDTWGLVLQRDESINEYLEKLALEKSRKSKVKMSSDQAHFSEGFTKGKEFEIIGGYID